MPFKFSLETLLRHRRVVEDRERLALQMINQRLARFRHSLDQITRQLRDHAQNRQTSLSDGVRASELQFLSECDAVLRHQTAALQIQVRETEGERMRQQVTLAKAQREREVLDSMREHCLDEFVRESTRREQRSLDELILMRRRHRTG